MASEFTDTAAVSSGSQVEVLQTGKNFPAPVTHACALFQSLSAVQAISFDLDDTLWDNKDVLSLASRAGEEWLLANQPSLADVLASKSISSRMMSLREKREDIAHCYTALRRAAMHEALHDGGIAPELHDQIVDSGMQAYSKARSAVTLWPGVLDTLNELRRRGYKLVALTNGNVTLEHIPSLEGVFDAYISPAQAGHAKPHKQPFKLACAAVGEDLPHVLHVGDSWDHDVVGAVAAGMPAAWLCVSASDLSPEDAASLQCAVTTSHIAGLLELLPPLKTPPP